MPREKINIPPGKMWKIRSDRKPPMGNWTYGTKAEIKPGTKLLFLAGAVPMDANGNIVGVGDLKAQYKQCIENIKIVLEAEGATLHDIVLENKYTTDVAGLMRLGEWRTKEYPEIKGKEVGDQTGAPGLTAGVTRLCDPDQLIEVQVMAVVHPK